MKKVYVLIVDTRSGISQNGMIEEPIKEGFEIDNALRHFGITRGNIEWYNQTNDVNASIMSGVVSETTKVVNIVCV